MTRFLDRVSRETGRWLVGLTLTALASSACFGAAPTGWTAAQPVGGVVFAALASGQIVAAEAASGTQRWSYPAEGNLGLLYFAPGVSDQVVIVPNTATAAGRVVALRGSDGQRLWEQELRSAQGAPVLPRSAPLIAGGTVYLGASDGTLFALDLATGQPRAGFAFKANDAIWGRPVLQGNTLYVTSLDHRLYALDPATGAVQRSFTANGAVPGSVAVGRLLYLSSLGETVYALDPATLNVQWSTQTSWWVWSEPLVDGETLYVGSFGRLLYALEAASGQVRWTLPLGGRVRARPVLAGDLIVVGADDGKIYAVSRSGEQQWSFNAGGAVLGDLAVEGDTLYASDNASHRLLALDLRSRTLRWEIPANR
ncbi:MAG: PQQ-binding-like beta-propeller repeat protein [Chloroflexi bacterium]|nr:PQQ-binding-like beta-propeller repeat protein [Chloroflexota bacterium]